MNKSEIQARIDAATKAMDLSDLDGIISVNAEVNKDSFEDFWAGSASQSYCDSVESGDVRVVKAK